MTNVLLPAVAVAISVADLLLLRHGLYVWAVIGSTLVGAVCVVIVSLLVTGPATGRPGISGPARMR